MRAGLSAVKFFAALLLGIYTAVKLVFSELWELIRGLGRAAAWLFREFTESIRARHRRNLELQKEVRKARKKDKQTYTKAVIHFIGSYFFGEGGICYTAFNYLLPVASFAFLIGVIRYGSGLEYGISVQFNGREIGVISEESEFDKAESEVRQRISLSDSRTYLDFDPKFSLRIVSDSDQIINSDQLANKMLEASDEELTEAYGIYINGNFIGAVKDKAPVEEALDNRLLSFHAEGNVTNISYRDTVEFAHGIYLAESLLDQKETVKMLTSSVEKRSVYIAQSGDSVVSVCRKYDMDIDDFRKLNPSLENTVSPGQMLFVTSTESYLPIQYVIQVEALSLLNYETVEFETSELNVGARQVMVKGVAGEKHTTYEITYVDGIERSRKTINSRVTRDPVVEQIGIGTYAAHPDSPATVLTGSGQFGWPVKGGYVSDPYMSDRNHKGLDIAAPGGTEIYAAADGKVIAAGWNTGGYGNVVQIAHEDGYQTVYAHMSAVLVVADQEVHRGQLIGLVGTTGQSTGNHCHFEVRLLGVCKNPANYLNTTDFAFADKKQDDEDGQQ
ncbi:MAG: peptidoglycan DD-metalloendopeptidase family protein [Ruminococcus sp.]|nr:peptidoglycan DD-metalloendopeptidase family protein [Ruminococcus sp.]